MANEKHSKNINQRGNVAKTSVSRMRVLDPDVPFMGGFRPLVCVNVHLDWA